MREPFQGVKNILLFNWHFYILAIVFVIVTLILSLFTPMIIQYCLQISCLLVVLNLLVSLIVSYWVYDVSRLYHFDWIDGQGIEGNIATINAGFDETSALLYNKLNPTQFTVLDFYNPLNHTEISIKRARKAYPPFKGTRQVTTHNLILENDSLDIVFIIFAAHEIRNESERVEFFNELNRILKPTGKIYLVEHLRDLPNFIAYTVGFFHFYSKSSWIKTFNSSRFILQREIKTTPFISTFTLEKHGITY